MNVTNALKEGTIKILARLNSSSLDNFFSSLGLPYFKEVGAANYGNGAYGTEMHFKWLTLGTFCAVLKWLSVFTSHCSSERRGLGGGVGRGG